jgi:hypothetical protein
MSTSAATCESYRRVLAEIGAKRKTDLAALRLELETMRSDVFLSPRTARDRRDRESS